ncbi:MAG TPA: DNA-binding response regulator [Firmicutes bacterium]|nr:DNA-binding response regulator [Bacillota bacterium]
MKTILLVEDDEQIQELLRFNLDKNGYCVVIAGDGYKAIDLAAEKRPDLILLDVMLPGMDGFELCRMLRASEETKEIPIIMLTAKGDELDVVLGLELGANDYVTKPFSIRELLSRIKNQLRQFNGRRAGQVSFSGDPGENIISAGGIVLKVDAYEVFVREKLVTLTQKEFALLKILMSNRGKVLTREFLLENIWDYNAEVDTRTVDVHIRYLRQKVEEDPANPRYIETVRGVGYCFRAR